MTNQSERFGKGRNCVCFLARVKGGFGCVKVALPNWQTLAA